MMPFAQWRDEDGHTVAEAVLALALFTGLLLPTGAFFGRVLAAPEARDRVAAQAAARQAVEEALYAEAFFEHTYASPDGRLLVRREVHHRDALVCLSVSVYRNRYRNRYRSRDRHARDAHAPPETDPERQRRLAYLATCRLSPP